MDKKGIIFDMDGTLWDSAEGVAKSWTRIVNAEYDKERVICDGLRYRNKMDKEIFNKAIQGYVSDTSKSIPKLMEYSVPLRCQRLVKDLIGVWL